MTSETSPVRPAPVPASSSPTPPTTPAEALAQTVTTTLTAPILPPPPTGAAPDASDASDTLDLSDAAASGFVSRRALITGPSAPVVTVARSTLAETWKWLWKDTLGRVVPFVVAAGVYARFSGLGWEGVGLSRPTARELERDITWGMVVGLPLAGLAAAFRARVAPRYRLPTASDQALQTIFYLGINAPAEELFWRGFVQTMVINGLGRLSRRLSRGRSRSDGVNATPIASADLTTDTPTDRPDAGAMESVVGWALTTTIFGVYHRLGGWSWRSIAGVTAAGGVFGALYLVPRKRRTIIPASIVHGLATAAFLSWGDATLHLLSRRRQRV